MKYTLSFLCLLVCLSCGQDKSDLKPLNLLKYGLPVTIQAPDSAKVKTSDMGIIKDVVVTDGEQYSVQIFSSTAITIDVKQLKKEQLADVKRNPYFSKLIREEDAGFIYENNVDSTLINYGFRHIKVMGDKEIVFQTGLIGSFSLEDVERMYAAVQ